jgi:hypothetical protein
MRTYNQTSEELETKIVELYSTGLSSTKVGELVDVSYATVLNVVRRRGFPTRTTTQTSKRYSFNENYFNTIDTENKAYWLGFILADGCISRGKDIIIALKELDKLHLEKFIKCINGDNKYQIVISNGFGGSYPTARLAIRSKLMCGDLQKYNITEKKSLTAVPPSIQKHLQQHFWRGVIDGDGHICINKQGPYTSLEVGLCGSKPIIQGFIDYVQNVLSFNLTLSTDKNIWRTKTSGKKAVKLCALLYTDAMVSLDRKIKTYEQYNNTNHSRLAP